MELAARLCLTLAVGAVIGYLLYRLKMPGGMMIGSVIGALLLNIGWDAAYMPLPMKVLAQVTAGAFIGCTVEKSDIYHLRYIFKPALILLLVHLSLNLAVGTLIYYVSALDATTALMSVVPGGLSDIPLIAADMGADAPKVMLMQFTRLLVGIGLFPTLIRFITRREQALTVPQTALAAVAGGAPLVTQADPAAPPVSVAAPPPRQVTRDRRPTTVCLTLGVALVFGLIGYFSGIQAGTLVFALTGVVLLKLTCNRAYLPTWLRRCAQVLAGAYIGSSMGLNDLIELRWMWLPVLIQALGYSAGCFVIGYLLHRFCRMPREEALLAGIPAGASDMVLIAGDLGVESTDLVVLQVIRLLVVISLFPQVILLLVRLL